MKELLIYILIFVLSYAGVELFRRWSLRRNLLDVPNERSSHTIPTPRGGGLIIVLISLSAYLIYSFSVSGSFSKSYVFGAILIAAVSWLDDLVSISVVWRFLIHFIAAGIFISEAGYFSSLYIPFFQFEETGIFGVILTLVWIVWLTNAYNFMDGIDGIAGVQAVSAGIGWLLIGKILGFESTAFYGGVLAAASLGFLIHNWHPAKIFMGDVGSAFLGYSFAVLPLLAKNESGQAFDLQPILLIVGILLVWLFVFDTLWTFANRLLRKEKVWQAHRSHIYQKMVINGLSHQFVTLFYGVISALTVLCLCFFLYQKII